MRSLAYPLAVLIVVAGGLAALAAVAVATRWGRWMVRAGGTVGVVGLLLTAGALGNLGVPRSCDGESASEVNRPAILVILGDGDCLRHSVLQVGVAALVGVGATGATTIRRSRRGGGGAVPVAQLP